VIIPKTKLREYVAPPGGIELDKAWLVVQYHYCRPLSERGRCPQDCGACAGTLAEIFDVGKADNLTAVLRWRMNGYVDGSISIWANTAPKGKPGQLDDLGLPRQVNPFVLYSEWLSKLE
jgi:hypothetical protein